MLKVVETFIASITHSCHICDTGYRLDLLVGFEITCDQALLFLQRNSFREIRGRSETVEKESLTHLLNEPLSAPNGGNHV